MAKFQEIDEQLWQEWVSGRPPIIQVMAARLRPDTLYKMKSTGSRVFPVSFSEDGTVTVAITGDFNAVMFERQVFDVSPDDLEECDLPADDEQLGAVLTDDADIEAYVDLMRPAVLAGRGIDT